MPNDILFGTRNKRTISMYFLRFIYAKTFSHSEIIALKITDLWCNAGWSAIEVNKVLCIILLIRINKTIAEMVFDCNFGGVLFPGISTKRCNHTMITCKLVQRNTNTLSVLTAHRTQGNLKLIPLCLQSNLCKYKE